MIPYGRKKYSHNLHGHECPICYSDDGRDNWKQTSKEKRRAMKKSARREGRLEIERGAK